MIEDIEKKIVILGAGPAGLGAAYRLQELGYRNWTIYERNSYIGGLAYSYQDSAGFTYDIGGRVLYSRYDYFNKLVDRLLGSNYTEVEREACVHLFNRSVPFPLQDNLDFLPPEVAGECAKGLQEARQHPERVRRAGNFGELVEARFGQGIARYFMKPYSHKFWGYPVEKLSRDWLGDRASLPDLESLVMNMLLDVDEAKGKAEFKFKYPLYGGTGGLFGSMRRFLGDHLHMNKEAVGIDRHARQLRFSDGEVVDYDLLLSTMPLDLLVNRLNSTPQEVRKAAGTLKHSGALILGIGVNRPTPKQKCWLYFPEKEVPFYRATYLSDYSPYLVPDEEHFLLLTETSYSEDKPEDKAGIVDRVVEGLIKTGILEAEDLHRIASTYLIDVNYSYPVPTLERNAALGTIQPFLMKHGIYSRGRFGSWEYEVGNTDHSFMQGVEVVNHWLCEEEETLWEDFGGTGEAFDRPELATPSSTAFPARSSVQVFSTIGLGGVKAGNQPLNLTPERLMPEVTRHAQDYLQGV